MGCRTFVPLIAFNTSCPARPAAASRSWIELHADSRFLGAVDGDLRDAVGLRQALRQDAVGGVVYLRCGQGVGGQRQRHDRRIGGIELTVVGACGEVRWQVGNRRVDRRLHVTRGAVDVAVYVELHDNGGIADRAGGGDFSDAGDLPKPAFQWCCDRVGHGLGICARTRGEHHDGRNIDAWQRGDREKAIGYDARQKQSERKQDRRDGTGNEGGGKPHGYSAGSICLPRCENRRRNRSNAR